MTYLTRRKKELLNSYNNLCSCYGDIISEQTKTINQLKELLKKLHRDVQEIVLYSHDIADIDQEDWFTISRRQADIANNIAKDIYNAIGEK